MPWIGTQGRQLALLAGLATVWLWLACDGRLHWDEPGYWYTAANFSIAEILQGDFQPSEVKGFSVSRTGHVLLLKAIVAGFGTGQTGLAIVIGCYLVMLAAFMALSRRILRRLAPDVRYAGWAVAIGAFAPIVPYLGFKTLAEIPALLLAAITVLAFLRALDSRPLPWMALSALSLAGVAITKNHTVLLFAGLVAALLACNGLGHRTGKILRYGFLVGSGSLAIFFALLWTTGITLANYLEVGSFVARLHDPLQARLITLLLECGMLAFALPLAFLGGRKSLARFYTVWFVLTTVPMLVFNRVEDRYLAVNLVPLLGLVQLSIEGLAPRLRRWWAERPALTAATAAACASLTIATDAVAQQLMFHGLRMDRLQTVLQRLDEAYGHNGYAILTPNEYTVFLYLRFVHPDRQVYTVFTPAPPNHHADPIGWAVFQKHYYGLRSVHTVDELRAIGKPLVYLTPESNPTVASARELLAHLPSTRLRQLGQDFIDSMQPVNPATLSWLWREPRVQLAVDLRYSPYVAMRARIGGV